MYTIKQLKERDTAVWLDTQEQYDKLLNLGFNMCSYNPNKLHSLADCTFSSLSTRTNLSCYDDHRVIEFSEIDFEERFIPQIFN